MVWEVRKFTHLYGHAACGLGIMFIILYSMDQSLISEPEIGKFRGIVNTMCLYFWSPYLVTENLNEE